MGAKKQAKQPQAKGAWKATTALAKNTMPKAKSRTLDFNKPLRTKRGESVRILTTDAKSKFPIVGLVMRQDGEEEMESWTAEGRNLPHGVRSDKDLENCLEVKCHKGVGADIPLVIDGVVHLVGVKLDVTITSDNVITHVELSQ